MDASQSQSGHSTFLAIPPAFPRKRTLASLSPAHQLRGAIAPSCKVTISLLNVSSSIHFLFFAPLPRLHVSIPAEEEAEGPGEQIQGEHANSTQHLFVLAALQLI